MNGWLNVIFKMMLDGHTNGTIYFYIKEHPDFNEPEKKLQKYIYHIRLPLMSKQCSKSFIELSWVIHLKR